MNVNTAKIEILIAEQGITKASLAQKCGISKQGLSVIFKRGSCEPRTAGKLAAGLDVPVSEIRSEVTA